MSQDQQIDEKIRLLCRLGKKIEAVKYFKDVSGLGLKEAKDYVDALEDGAALAMPEQPTGVVLEERLLHLCKRGGYLAAIKMYRDATGSDFRASKEYVDQLVASNLPKPQATDQWAGFPDDLSSMADPGSKRNLFQRILAFFTGDKA